MGITKPHTWLNAFSAVMVKRILLPLMLSVALSPAHADWLQGHTARLQTLDKITARIATIEIPVGTPQRYGSLQIIIHACNARPPTMAPEHAALMAIRVVDHNGVVADMPIFQGWMFASSPGLNALEHPVYDVSVLACIKD